MSQPELGGHHIPTVLTDCRLSEPDGTLVSSGRACWSAGGARDEIVMSGVDHPGRLVSRCLLGPVRQVVLHLRDGRALPAVVDRVRFDPQLGRVCVLRLAAAREPAVSLPTR